MKQNNREEDWRQDRLEAILVHSFYTDTLFTRPIFYLI